MRFPPTGRVQGGVNKATAVRKQVSVVADYRHSRPKLQTSDSGEDGGGKNNFYLYLMRRIIITALLILAFLGSKAQHIDNQVKPVVMIDSVPIPYNSLSQIDPQTIASVNIQKDKMYPGGVIYITLKDSTQAGKILKSKKLSLQDLADKYIPKEDKGRPILFVMNRELVTDTSNVRIFSDLYYSVGVVKAEDSPYFKNAFPKALLLMVSTYISIK